MNYLILKYDVKSVFYPMLNCDKICSFYKKDYNKLFFRIINKLNLNRILFGDWIKKIDNVDSIIIFDNYYSKTISKYIKKHYPKCRIILYFWNVINSSNDFILEDKKIDEFWTFDKSDADKYQLSWNSQFYTNKVNLPKNNISYDLIFLGREKGREVEINKINEFSKKNGLRANLKIICNENDLITYDKYLNLISESKAILDILSPGQNGMTLRCMESIFLEKKLITNNKDVANYNFYNKQNIFILGKDNLDDLLQFLTKPYKKISKEIVDYYDYESWLKRFFEGK